MLQVLEQEALRDGERQEALVRLLGERLEHGEEDAAPLLGVRGEDGGEGPHGHRRRRAGPPPRRCGRRRCGCLEVDVLWAVELLVRLPHLRGRPAVREARLHHGEAGRWTGSTEGRGGGGGGATGGTATRLDDHRAEVVREEARDVPLQLR